MLLSLSSTLVAALLSAPSLHAGPAGYADALGSGYAPVESNTARVATWPGSEALIEVLLDADDTPLESVTIEVEPPHASIPTPTLYQCVPGGGPLMTVAPGWSQPPNTRRAFLLRYAVPPKAKPGSHAHMLRVSARGESRPVELTLTLHVADFTADWIYALPAVGGVSWPPIIEGLSAADSRAALFDAWRGVPALLWPRAHAEATLRPEDVKAFVQAQAGMDALGPVLLAGLLPPSGDAPRTFSQHVESARLGRWPEWIRETNWASGVQIELGIAGDLASQQGQLNQFRSAFAGAGVLLAGPYVPALQEGADGWALSLEEARHVAQELSNGVSAADSPPSPLTLIGAAAGEQRADWPALQTSAADALDGGITTYWMLPTKESVWMELGNPEGLAITEMVILGDVHPETVITHFPGQPSSTSSVTWKQDDERRWIGKFKYPAEFDALRIEFPKVSQAGTRIHEILLGNEQQRNDALPMQPMATWVMLPNGVPLDSLCGAVLQAESIGVNGVHLGTLPLLKRDTGNITLDLPLTGERPSPASVGGKRKTMRVEAAAAPAKAEAMCVGYWVNGRTMPAYAALRLADALHDAALLRSLRALGSLAPAGESSLQWANAEPGESVEASVERLKTRQSAREALLDAFAKRNRKN